METALFLSNQKMFYRTAMKENEFSAIAADQYDKKIYESNGTGTLTIKDKKIIFKDVEVLYNGAKKTLRGAYQFE